MYKADICIYTCTCMCVYTYIYIIYCPAAFTSTVKQYQQPAVTHTLCQWCGGALSAPGEWVWWHEPPPRYQHGEEDVCPWKSAAVCTGMPLLHGVFGCACTYMKVFCMGKSTEAGVVASLRGNVITWFANTGNMYSESSTSIPSFYLTPTTNLVSWLDSSTCVTEPSCWLFLKWSIQVPCVLRTLEL